MAGPGEVGDRAGHFLGRAGLGWGRGPHELSLFEGCVWGEGGEAPGRGGEGREGVVKPWEESGTPPPPTPGWARLPAVLAAALEPPGDSASDGGVLGALLSWVTQ